MSRLLVVGAQKGSLGAAVAQAGCDAGMEVTTAGIGPDEHRKMDALLSADVQRVLADVRPHHVVCTVGKNSPVHFASPYWLPEMADALQTNVLGPAMLMQQWLRTDVPGLTDEEPGHFVVISSNSAHIARTLSAPYCASKAALSMMVRVVAREYARTGDGETSKRDRQVYAYEPGLIATQATQVLAQRLGEDVPLHRMPGVGPTGYEPDWLADVIVRNLLSGRGLNGSTIRIDGGEQ